MVVPVLVPVRAIPLPSAVRGRFVVCEILFIARYDDTGARTASQCLVCVCVCLCVSVSVCVSVSLQRAVIACLASIHTALVSSPNLAALHLPK